MKLHRSRWSKVYESSEEELLDLLDSMGHTYSVEELSAGDTHTNDMHTTSVQLWCAEGSAIVDVNNTHTSMQPGDCIIIPTNVAHDICAGIAGCTWYQTIYKES